MTWESLTDRVLTTFGPDVPRVKVKKYLQEAEEDFALGTRCYVKDFSYMPFKTDAYIELPKDFIELKGNVEFKTRTLDRVSHFEDFSRFKTDGTIKAGNPEHYYVRGERMYIYPAVSNVGLIAFSYVARPVQLDSLATYKYLQFDDLESDQFYVDNEIMGRTSLATATVAEIVDLSQKQATLVLSDVSGTFQDNEVIVVTSDEQDMWLDSYSNDWSQLLTNWQTLGLGGIADVRGLIYDFSGAGASPSIPQNYHTYLVCYAKAAIAEDNGDLNGSSVYRNKYESDKDKARIQSSHKGIDGVQAIVDVYGGSFL
jgi:hypothetical protein